ncbi:ABC transporter ATP-binding protein [Flammeovirga sp. MY04]|uniref:ABC transporter ATP-binding protein n=1 Tax=Flammeovirga sp. MY04 TaxID=1191459 RepID=UPI0008062FC8|nr:ATP-binding cassette domain-containing protein [Flammeovirga sp. MY04]ANQ51077.1 ABC transporter ATP-binding protein [Flammeovirga sp. MY04]
MKIELSSLGKRFAREWIFRDINYSFVQDKIYAITGGNGSGKSTFLRILAGINDPSKGQINYYDQKGKKIAVEDIWKVLSIAGPYTELIEEFTLEEHLDFHFSLKKGTKTKKEIIDILGFEKSKNKQVQDFSSGMKQKLKLALAFFTEGEILLLDEPTSNLDANNIKWYQNWLEKVKQNKLLIICSNQKYEYEICNEIISIESYKF